jgi:fibro-slime domain-containing protein
MNAPGGANGTGSTPGGGIKPGGTIVTDDLTKCGNGRVDGAEQCDDGNKVGADGCNALCQIEADWECPPTGGACIYTARCGDGKVSSSEACDDGNADPNDGCAADCSAVETGWQCRVPGRRCIPFCGDGLITGTENCDDGNANPDDGCSVRCQVEPGWTCTPGGGCTKAQCGNGIVETGETCDLGADNGKFHGDGSGCSKTCTQEPLCRDPATGVTQACATGCGSGNVDPGEGCDDGNLVDGDGCSAACTQEAGFECPTQENTDTQACGNGAGQCLVLPITYRDFNSQKEANGHPDFFYMGATVGGQKTLCVPNASGMPLANWDGGECPNSDSTDMCTGLVKDSLGPDGKPVFNDARPGGAVCDCRFTDWDSNILSTNNAGTTCSVSADGSTHNRLEQQVTVIHSAESFNQWYHASDLSTEVPGTLELAQVGTTNQYQFSSSGGRTVYDDLHDIFLGTETTITAGFFPLDEAAGVEECNIWPYWVVAGGTCAAGSGYAVGQQWDPRGWYDENNKTGGPIPGGGSKSSKVLGEEHNFWFTSEVRYLFKYVGGEKLEFFGDDDVWVFINGKLVLDLGAVHERLKGSVTLTDTGASVKITAQDNTTGGSIAVDSLTVGSLGLVVGNTYEIAVFHADRHPRESNYQLTLSGFSTTRSVCLPECGDGVATAGEECDDGPANSPDAYGGCTPECKYGPYCGDGVINGPEICDDGPNNGAAYGANACSTACTPAHRCGDGFIDSAFGEQCDMGELNGTGSCTKECTVINF